MNHGSLFSGIGGFDLASEWMGWENEFYCEIDNWCLSLLEKRFPNAKKQTDARTADFKKYKGTDVLSMGVPCQDASVSGLGAGIYGANTGLWSCGYRAIEEIAPKYVLIENSPNLLRKGFEKILYDLSSIGYDAEWECISASDFGFDHIRKRVWVLAYPNVQRRRGILHNYKRSLVEKNRKTNPLDSSCHPFLRFEKMFGEPAVFRVDDGLSKRLDVVNRLGGAGNAIVPEIAFGIFKAIEQNKL